MDRSVKVRLCVVVALCCLFVFVPMGTPPPVFFERQEIVRLPDNMPVPVQSHTAEPPVRFEAVVRSVTPGHTTVVSLRYDDDDQRIASLARDMWARRAQGVPGLSFVTEYAKIKCGAMVTNMCLWRGQPRYFRPGKQLFTSKGGTLSCNEAGSKQRFFMVMYNPASLERLAPGREGVAISFDPAAGMMPYEPNTILVVPYCWELYGYHLVLCLQATYAHVDRLQLRTALPGNITLRVAFMRGGTFTAYRAGSNVTWKPSRKILQQGADPIEPTVYWPLWKSIVPHPWLVDPLPLSPPRCYGMAVVAGYPSTEITPNQALAWRHEVLQQLDVRRKRPSRACASYKTVLIQRQTNFFVKDMQAVADAVRRIIGSDAEVVVLEGLSFDQQVELAVEADVMVGVHGNGLTWVSLMQNSSVLLELWPSSPYNANYYHLATRADVKLFTATGDGTCPRRCSANFASRLEPKLMQIRQFLDSVHCNGIEYDPRATYVEERAIIKARKAAKRRAKPGL